MTTKKMTALMSKKINSKIKPINEQLIGINWGGCGVFACYLAERLRVAGYDAKVIELRDADCEPRSAEDLKINNENMHTAAVKHASPNDCNVHADSHYCVNVGDYYFDSYVVTKASANDTVVMYDGDEYNIVGEVPLNNMEYFSIENRGIGLWNRMYDTALTPKIKTFIDKELSFLTPKKAKK